jgi:hypothetical protein
MARMTLEDLVAQLRKVYEERLRAVVLYGSSAAGEYIEHRSDRNVLVLVDGLDLQGLRNEAAVARGWVEAGNPPPLTLTIAEWRGCADVFPMEVADILERHRVLHGSPPFDGMAVERRHLRAQAEQQALGKLVQLRQGVLAAGAQPERVIELLARSLSTFMVIFRAAARLHGEDPPTDYAALVRSVAAGAGFDPAPFLAVVRHIRGEAKLARGDADPVLVGYLGGLERLVAHLNVL